MLGPGAGAGLTDGRWSEPPAAPPPMLGAEPACCMGPSPSLASRAAAPGGSGLPQARAASTAPSPLALGPESLPARSLPRSLHADLVDTFLGLPLNLSTTLPAAEPRGRAIATAAFPPLADPSTITPFGAELTDT